MSGQTYAEQTLPQSSSATKEELSDIFRKLVRSFKPEEKESERIAVLRQLFIVTKNSEHVSVPQDVINTLAQGLASPGKTKITTKTLCGLILQELVPGIALSLSLDAAHLDENQVPSVLDVAAVQSCSDPDVLRRLVPQLIKWISTVGLHVDVVSSSLCVTATVLTINRKSFSTEQKRIISCQIVEWLKNVSLHQGANPYSRGLFKKDGNEDFVVEMDGTPAKGSFTVLCVGQYYRADQLLNIFTFSLLRQWLEYESSCTGAEDMKESEATLDASVQYSLRILEQCNRKSKLPHDMELQQAALIEAISQLDCVCSQNPAFIPKVFEEVKNVSSKVSASQPRVMVPLMQYFLNHSDAVVHDAFHVYAAFFNGVLETSFSSPTISFEAMTFIRKNLFILCKRTPLLQKFFPNILKIFAWHPGTYISDIADIVSSFLSPTTSIEVIHALLDLPCLSAALELARQGGGSVGGAVDPGAVTVTALSDPRYKPLFKFILRNQSGSGDTIDRLSVLHSTLEGHKSHPRVVMCAEAVPILVKQAFGVVLEEGDRVLAGSLVTVLLERSGLLFGEETFQSAVRKVLSTQLVAIFRKWPHLVMDQFSDLLDFVGGIRNITGRQDFFIHVVWVIGEFLSTSYDPRCKPEHIAAMYESLEAVSYETSGIVQAAGSARPGSRDAKRHLVGSSDAAREEVTSYSPALLTALMSAVAKLASRSQDLIPRVMLCLTKLGQVGQVAGLDEASRRALSERSNELLNLMRLPHIAAVVLSPPADLDSGRWHRDNLALPVLLQTTTDVLQGFS